MGRALTLIPIRRPASAPRIGTTRSGASRVQTSQHSVPSHHTSRPAPSTHLGRAVLVLLQVLGQLLYFPLNGDAQRPVRRRLHHREHIRHQQVVPLHRHPRRRGHAKAVAADVHGGDGWGCKAARQGARGTGSGRRGQGGGGAAAAGGRAPRRVRRPAGLLDRASVVAGCPARADQGSRRQLSGHRCCSAHLVTAGDLRAGHLHSSAGVREAALQGAWPKRRRVKVRPGEPDQSSGRQSRCESRR